MLDDTEIRFANSYFGFTVTGNVAVDNIALLGEVVCRIKFQVTGYVLEKWVGRLRLETGRRIDWYKTQDGKIEIRCSNAHKDVRRLIRSTMPELRELAKQTRGLDYEIDQPVKTL